MRHLPLTALAFASLMAIGAAACSDASQNPPAESPAQTGSIPADPATQPDPAAQPQDPLLAPEQPAQ